MCRSILQIPFLLLQICQTKVQTKFSSFNWTELSRGVSNCALVRIQQIVQICNSFDPLAGVVNCGYKSLAELDRNCKMQLLQL